MNSLILSLSCLAAFGVMALWLRLSLDREVSSPAFPLQALAFALFVATQAVALAPEWVAPTAPLLGRLLAYLLLILAASQRGDPMCLRPTPLDAAATARDEDTSRRLAAPNLAALVIPLTPLLLGFTLDETSVAAGAEVLASLMAPLPMVILAWRGRRWAAEDRPRQFLGATPQSWFAAAYGLIAVGELAGQLHPPVDLRSLGLGLGSVAILLALGHLALLPFRLRLFARMTLWIILGVGTGGGAILALIGGPGGVDSSLALGLLLLGAALSVGLLAIDISFACRPIEALSAQTMPMRHGSLRQVSLQSTGDEVEDLSRSLRIMVNAIERNRRDLEDQIHKMSATEKQREEFLANVSHELRTPLTIIIGNTELLLEGVLDALSPDQEAFLEDVHEQALQLQQLITDIVDFTVLERGDARLVKRPLRLDLIVAEQLDRFEAMARQRKITVVSRLEQVTMEGDALKLQQVVFHLLSNAFKFNKVGGEVRVELGLSEPDEGPAQVRLTVQDRGIGIPPEQLTQIYEQFAQLDGSSTRQHGGVGVGLPLVKSIVQLHGGRIDVMSKPGAGARFTVSLPRGSVPEERDQRPGRPAEGTSRDRGRLVLVGERDEKLARLLATYLANGGFNPYTVTGGEALERALEDLQPALLVLNPDMLGDETWRAFRLVRRHPKGRTLPLILVGTRQQVPLDLNISGLDLYLYPLPARTLLRAVQRALDRPSAVGG